MNKIKMPAGARYIIEQLNKHGFEAYIVGGCVRDSLLGKTPNDWDITTSATPQQVKKIFRKTVDTGILHGTVTVLVDKKILLENVNEVQKGPLDDMQAKQELSHYDYAFEVTTYRVDGEYQDHRRPTEVTFTASLDEDLKRRDFTINAMAYSPIKGVVDIFGGQQDLRDGVIRAVGVPKERFEEDALRILRAVRFGAQLGFTIEDGTKRAMSMLASNLKHISVERIQVELTKLITSRHPDRLVEAYELGLTKIFLPEFDAMMETTQNNPFHLYSVGVHTIKVMENIEPTPVLRYTALLHDVAKPVTKTTGEDGMEHFFGHPESGAHMAEEILRRLKFDNRTIDMIKLLVRWHDFGMDNLTMKGFRRFMNKLGRENFKTFMSIKRADMAGQSDYNIKARREQFVKLQLMYDKLIEENQCINMSEMALKGRDLIELGISPGVQMGNILKSLFEMVLEDPSLNDREKLTKIVKDMI